jgi:hypothetical protein
VKVFEWGLHLLTFLIAGLKKSKYGDRERQANPNFQNIFLTHGKGRHSNACPYNTFAYLDEKPKTCYHCYYKKPWGV